MSSISPRRAAARAVAAACAAAALAVSSPRADLVYESGTQGPTGQTAASGVPIDYFRAIGVRFEVTDFTSVDRIGGHLGANANPSGTLYGKLLQLTGPNDLPNLGEDD